MVNYSIATDKKSFIEKEMSLQICLSYIKKMFNLLKVREIIDHNYTETVYFI